MHGHEEEVDGVRVAHWNDCGWIRKCWRLLSPHRQLTTLARDCPYTARSCFECGFGVSGNGTNSYSSSSYFRKLPTKCCIGRTVRAVRLYVIGL